MTLNTEWRKQVVRRHLERREQPRTPSREIASSSDCKTPPKPASDALVKLLWQQGYEHLSVADVERAVKAS